LFSFLSITWAGKLLRPWPILLESMKDATTQTSLKVNAVPLAGKYKTGTKVEDAERWQVRLRRQKTCPSWHARSSQANQFRRSPKV
jgi:hypothetical protein